MGDIQDYMLTHVSSRKYTGLYVNTCKLWGDIQDCMLTHVSSGKYTGLHVNTCKLWGDTQESHLNRTSFPSHQPQDLLK